jgi:hypothetical protein
MSVIAMFRQREHRDSRHPVDLSIRSWSKAVKSSSQELPMRANLFSDFMAGMKIFRDACAGHNRRPLFRTGEVIRTLIVFRLEAP